GRGLEPCLITERRSDGSGPARCRAPRATQRRPGVLPATQRREGYSRPADRREEFLAGTGPEQPRETAVLSRPGIPRGGGPVSLPPHRDEQWTWFVAARTVSCWEEVRREFRR